MKANRIRQVAQAASAAAVLGLTQLAYAAKGAPSVWTPPHDASEYGHNVDWLINVTNIFSALLFAVMLVWLGIAFVKHNKNHTAEFDHGDAKKQVKKALLLSAVIFFIVDGNLWWNSTKDVNGLFWNFAKVNEDKKAIKIEIQGRQWIWQARYPGPDGKFNSEDDALSDTELVVPVNTPISLQLASPDVIHTYGLPNFRIKQDAMPGMINMMWFQSKETGTFDIVCFQHCGVNHYKMKGVLRVVERPEYESWVALKVRDSKAIWDEKDNEAHWGWDWKSAK